MRAIFSLPRSHHVFFFFSYFPNLEKQAPTTRYQNPWMGVVVVQFLLRNPKIHNGGPGGAYASAAAKGPGGILRYGVGVSREKFSHFKTPPTSPPYTVCSNHRSKPSDPYTSVGATALGTWVHHTMTHLRKKFGI